MLRRFAHALEGVEEVQVARGVAARHQGQCHQHHAAAAPDAAFDDFAGNAVLDDVIHRSDEAGAPLQARHGEGVHTRDDLAVSRRQVGQRLCLAVGRAAQFPAGAIKRGLDDFLHAKFQ